jgi:hypothetical protein
MRRVAVLCREAIPDDRDAGPCIDECWVKEKKKFENEPARRDWGLLCSVGYVFVSLCDLGGGGKRARV